MPNTSFHRTTLISFFTILGLCFAATINAAESSAGKELQLGSVAMDIPAEMVKRLTPLTKYLSSKIGQNVSFHASPNLGSAVEDLGKNTTQIAYLTPAAYLEAREKYAAIPLVNPLSKGKGSFTLMIAVQKDSPVKSIQDLRGKKFAFGDKKAILQPAVVENAGIKLEEFASYDYLNHYDNIAKAVINGDFDAGIVKDTIAEKFAAQGLRVIYTSPPLPSYIFAVNKNLPPKTIAKLKDAMLALKTDSEENKAILTSLEKGYDGFETASDNDFDAIRKLLGHGK
ncbi:MAG: phosphate/phosphite/phosphonate ABC transporter substrate-binding protein, partial [Gallionellaceae bacterium]